MSVCNRSVVDCTHSVNELANLERREKCLRVTLIDAEVRAVRPQFPAQQLLSSIDYSVINARQLTFDL